MENKESYFGEVGSAIKTLAVGLKTTLREYFTAKSTEQYPETVRQLSMLPSATADALSSLATKMKATSVLLVLCARSHVLMALSRFCLTWRKIQRLDVRRRNSTTISTTLATACSANCVSTHVTSVPLSSLMISRMLSSIAVNWFCISTKRFTRVVRFLTSSRVVRQ